MRIPLFQVDAFTDRPFAGNPAAVCVLDSWLDDWRLQAVASENNLSATAFLVKSGGDMDYELRWFTRVCEIQLCGHATLAAAHVVLQEIAPELAFVRFATRRSGSLKVRKDGTYLAMDFPALESKDCTHYPEQLLQALNAKYAPMKVLEGNQTYIAVYGDEDSVRHLLPDLREIGELHPYVVAVTAPGTEVDFVSRYFAPSYGVPEDPVTGSLHCVLTPYWAKRFSREHLRARQRSERGGDIYCEMAGERVILKGQAVLVKKADLII